MSAYCGCIACILSLNCVCIRFFFSFFSQLLDQYVNWLIIAVARLHIRFSAHLRQLWFLDCKRNVPTLLRCMYDRQSPEGMMLYKFFTWHMTLSAYLTKFAHLFWQPLFWLLKWNLCFFSPTTKWVSSSFVSTKTEYPLKCVRHKE